MKGTYYLKFRTWVEKEAIEGVGSKCFYVLLTIKTNTPNSNKSLV